MHKKEPETAQFLLKLVPEAGLEPASCCQRGILNPLCLPIPPLRLVQTRARSIPTPSPAATGG